MDLEELTGKNIHWSELRRGQEVRVRLGAEDLGAGMVDDLTSDGQAIWIIFGGPTPRRVFIPEDRARFTTVERETV